MAVALVAVAREGDWAPQTGLALTAATLLGVAAWWALRVWPTWQRTRAMRVSLREAQMATNRLALEAESHG